MSKILYPVGTKVVLSEYADRNHENLTPLYVVEYRKGKKFPYGLSKTKDGSTETFKGHKFRSVKGLKRYNPTQAKVAQEVSTPDVASPKQTPTQEYYTREEVDTLMAQQYQDVLELLSVVDETAFKAFQKSNRIAKVVDHNFSTVAKQFQSLNHDDN